MQKVKEPEAGTTPTATPATPSTKVIEGPVAPKVQGDVKKMMSVRSTINDARDDLVAAFTAAGIPLKKIEHRRAVVHIDNIMAKRPDQWKFHKQVRIPNPVNLGDMQHDLPSFTHQQQVLSD